MVAKVIFVTSYCQRRGNPHFGGMTENDASPATRSLHWNLAQ
jgi:hypothetical protein